MALTLFDVQLIDSFPRLSDSVTVVLRMALEDSERTASG